VFVALGIQHATRLRHIAICGLFPLYDIFTYFLTNGTIFGKKKVTEPKIFVLIFFYKFCPKYFSFEEEMTEV